MRLERVCLVGEEFTKAVAEEGKDFACYPTSDALLETLEAQPLTGYTVLVKGSRGIRMEKVIPAL